MGMDNLTLGVEKNHADGNPARVKAICQALSIPNAILDLCQLEHALPWHAYVSKSEAQLLSLARAFIANPELLCLEKPTSYFNKDSSVVFAKYLKEQFVETR